jgi:hypothetical protein
MLTKSARTAQRALLGSSSAEALHRILLYPIVFGIVLRLVPASTSDFPVHDGAFFYAIVRDLQSNGFRLPWYSSFNQLQIPMVYPPLPFYAMAILDRIVPLDLLTLFRFLPGLIAAGTIPAFYVLSCDILPSRGHALVSTAAFSLSLPAYRWLVMGGGLARATGVLFCLIALHHSYRLFAMDERGRLVYAIIFCGLTLLSHPEVSYFLAYSIALIVAFHRRSWTGVKLSLALALGTLLVAAPWLVTALVRHGGTLLNPFLDSGSGFGGGLITLLRWQIVPETFLPLVSFLGLAGLFASLVSRCPYVAVWLFSVYLLQSRAPNQRAIVPFALLIGYGVMELRRLRFVRDASLGTVRVLAVSLVLFLCLSGGLACLEFSFYNQLSGDLRAAMAWARDRTPESSRFLVAPSGPWYTDRVGEWFPVLAERQNVGVIQGREWFGDFSEEIARHDRLYDSVLLGEGALVQWARESGVSFTHVFIGRDYPESRTAYAIGSEQLIEELKADPACVLVYDQAGVAIFELRSPDDFFSVHAQVR